MKYFIADLHFGDLNIMKIENRPFCDVDEMADTIVNNWNNIVSSDDEVFIAGDIAGVRPVNKDALLRFLEQLNGRITIIAGNHDKDIIEDLRIWGYNVSEYPILIDGFWIVSHEPVYIVNKGPYANIFGHVHANPMYKTVSNRSYCVCVERNNYTPVSFDEIKKKVYAEDYKDD